MVQAPAPCAKGAVRTRAGAMESDPRCDAGHAEKGVQDEKKKNVTTLKSFNTLRFMKSGELRGGRSDQWSRPSGRGHRLRMRRSEFDSDRGRLH
ncbi:hypothetical protein EVAR_26673_1 [Eumeta japonica]|uniref:Uncharacterized protein n=1 Tax=Eumeta variegata TaxID=151549 RepID=A0A4C1VLX3_EUMVA|nr:hypothetical protein EVAR_26673_1 [Eumeta japonica]